MGSLKLSYIRAGDAFCKQVTRSKDDLITEYFNDIEGLLEAHSDINTIGLNMTTNSAETLKNEMAHEGDFRIYTSLAARALHATRLIFNYLFEAGMFRERADLDFLFDPFDVIHLDETLNEMLGFDPLLLRYLRQGPKQERVGGFIMEDGVLQRRNIEGAVSVTNPRDIKEDYDYAFDREWEKIDRDKLHPEVVARIDGIMVREEHESKMSEFKLKLIKEASRDEKPKHFVLISHLTNLQVLSGIKKFRTGGCHTGIIEY